MRSKLQREVLRATAGVLAVAVLAGCSSTTTISSRPSGAIVYVDGVRKGPAPVRHSDSAPLGAVKQVRLEKEGYRPLTTVIRKDELQIGPLIGGILVLVPFIWLMGYPPQCEFELEPLPAAAATVPTQP